MPIMYSLAVQATLAGLTPCCLSVEFLPVESQDLEPMDLENPFAQQQRV